MDCDAFDVDCMVTVIDHFGHDTSGGSARLAAMFDFRHPSMCRRGRLALRHACCVGLRASDLPGELLEGHLDVELTHIGIAHEPAPLVLIRAQGC
jgi:hypothetical protein